MSKPITKKCYYARDGNKVIAIYIGRKPKFHKVWVNSPKQFQGNLLMHLKRTDMKKIKPGQCKKGKITFTQDPE